MRKMTSVLLIILGSALLIAGLYGIFGQKSRESDVDERHALTDSLISQPSDGLSDSERKGQQFEDYVISRFPEADYQLVEKVNDYTSRHHTSERSKYADLVFRNKSTGEDFAVECKYRSGWMDAKGKPALHWVEQRKIDDYNQFSRDRNIDVIVVFGVGGTSDHPEEVFSLPLRLLQKPLPQHQDFLRKFKLPDGDWEYDGRKHNLHTL